MTIQLDKCLILMVSLVDYHQSPSARPLGILQNSLQWFTIQNPFVVRWMCAHTVYLMENPVFLLIEKVQVTKMMINSQLST